MASFWDQIAEWWNKPPAPPTPKPNQRPYYSNTELKAAPKERVPGPTNQQRAYQGSAKAVRQQEFKPAEVQAPNEFQRTNSIRKRTDLKPSAWVANPNLGKETRGEKDTRDAVTLDDYLDIKDQELKTGLSYQGQEVKTVGGKGYKKLGNDQKLSAQHNTLLDELSKLDYDMYSKLDSSGDKRTTWGEARDKSPQKGAAKAFEAVRGRAPTADDTFTPNIDAYLNLAGVKGLDLYTGKDEQDIVNDLYIGTDELDAIRSGADPNLTDEDRDRVDVANDLFQGVQGLQGAFRGSEGVAVNVGDDRGTSELDLTRFGPEQRVNLAMIIGTSIMDEDPQVLLELNARAADAKAAIGLGAGTAEELAGAGPSLREDQPGDRTSPYAAPGMGGLKLDLLADPKVRQELESYRSSLDAVIEDAKAGGVSQEEVFKLLSGKDLPDVKAAEFMDYINSDVLPKTGKLDAGQLQEWITRQNSLFDAQKSKGPDGVVRRSTGGDENLREMLMGGKATVDSAVQQEPDDQGTNAAAPKAKPKLDERVAYLRDQARYQGQELIDLLVAEGYDEASARSAVTGG